MMDLGDGWVVPVTTLSDGTKEYGTPKQGRADGAGGGRPDFGVPGPSDLPRMVTTNVSNISTTSTGTKNPRRKDLITKGSMFTPTLTASDRAFDPLDIIGRFSGAASDSMLAGRSPKDPVLAPQIADHIGLENMAAATEAALPLYQEMQDEWMRGHGYSYRPESNEFVKKENFLGVDWIKPDPRTGRENFIKKGGPGYEAFKAVLAPRLVKDGGLNLIEVAAIRQHAKEKGIDYRTLIDEIGYITEEQAEIAKAEISGGIDIVAVIKKGDKKYWQLSDGSLEEAK